MITNKQTCPICCMGHLHNKIEKNFGIDLHFSVCDNCGSEQANPEQLHKNKMLRIADRKQALKIIRK